VIYHSLVVVVLGLIAFTLLAIDGNMKRIADALKAQNDFYGIFEQTSEELPDDEGVTPIETGPLL
jgi:hypothetical protein